jgi:hypothetical protein
VRQHLENSPDPTRAEASHMQRLDHLLVWTFLSILLYGILHGPGRYFPVSLWGVDQLHYYPFWVTALFSTVVALCALLALKPAWTEALDDRLRPLLDKPFLATIRFQILVGLVFTLTGSACWIALCSPFWSSL